jgi:hypothetical protein
MKTYSYPVETWDAAKCAKIAKRRGTDGMGAKHPYSGLIAGSASTSPEYGQTIRYNGGTVIDGEHYDAVHRPLPQIAPGFAFLKRISWGTYLVKEGENR